VLLTFHAEIRSAARTEYRRVIAVLLPRDGPAVEITQHTDWLGFAQCGDAAASNVWRDRFFGWVPGRQVEAEALAAEIMNREAVRFTCAYQNAREHAMQDLQQWLRIRAEEICGALLARTGDLFGGQPDNADWRSLSSPLDRLIGFAADDSNALPQRREASEVVQVCTQRSAGSQPLPPPTLLPIGMLMLVPASLA